MSWGVAGGLVHTVNSRVADWILDCSPNSSPNSSPVRIGLD
jgi:hypothetical protein